MEEPPVRLHYTLSGTHDYVWAGVLPGGPDPQRAVGRYSRLSCQGGGVSFCPGGKVLGALAKAKIAKGFAGLAGMLEISKNGGERGCDFFFGNEVLIDEVQPVAEEAAAEQDGVFAA